MDGQKSLNFGFLIGYACSLSIPNVIKFGAGHFFKVVPVSGTKNKVF